MGFNELFKNILSKFKFGFKMDKKIKKIQKETKKVGKDLKTLAKDDHKRDKVCDYGKKEMAKKKK